MSIDETSLSNGEVYTFLSNKDVHCKKGSIAAYVKDTKSDDIVKDIMRISEEVRSSVLEVTMDLSESMRASIEACFPNARRVIDRFHVQQEVCAGLNEIRPITLGRKNYLFCGNHEAAENMCIIISILSTCRNHGVNPREYLSDIIARMPYMEKAAHDKLVELLPHRWKLHQTQSMTNR